MKTQRSFLIAVLAAALASGSASGGEERGRAGTGEPGLQRVTGTPVYTWLNINNISTILRNNGTSDINVAQTNSGPRVPQREPENRDVPERSPVGGQGRGRPAGAGRGFRLHVGHAAG